ncbi:MAG: TIR domain-containing protein [Geminicoccales bacterium]
MKNLDGLGILRVWDDRDIKADVDWYAKIHDVLSRTKVAICLISPDFLSSSFCLDEKVSCLLQRRDRGDLEVFPILLRDCFWDEHNWLKRLQMLPALEGMLTKSW